MREQRGHAASAECLHSQSVAASQSVERVDKGTSAVAAAFEGHTLIVAASVVHTSAAPDYLALVAVATAEQDFVPDRIVVDTSVAAQTVEVQTVETFLRLVVVKMETEAYSTAVHTIVAVAIAVARVGSAQTDPAALVGPVAANCTA